MGDDEVIYVGMEELVEDVSSGTGRGVHVSRGMDLFWPEK